jgi:hypothetical protein
MKARLQKALVLLLPLFWISPCASQGYSPCANQGQLNDVKIIAPPNGQAVGSYVIAEVFAKINDKSSKVWVFAHIKQLGDQWYPQTAPIKNSKGNWEAYVRIGEPPDIGLEFEIAAATFNQDGEREILRYHELGRQTGRWVPIPMPTCTSNLDTVIVKKISH